MTLRYQNLQGVNPYLHVRMLSDHDSETDFDVAIFQFNDDIICDTEQMMSSNQGDHRG